jgi:hypothetical protein
MGRLVGIATKADWGGAARMRRRATIQVVTEMFAAK